MRLLAIALCALLTVPALAQTWPSRPVKVIVPFTAGSATDILARTFGQKLQEVWGQPVVVENHPGAGGTIGAGIVAKSTPDGYTLLVHSAGFAMNPFIYPELPYDSAKDFVDIAPLGGQPNVLVVASNSGIKSVADLIAQAKQKPGVFNYGSAGIGSGTHVNAEKFRLATGIDAVHVPYKGTPEALKDTPTIAEAGVPGFDYNLWVGLFGPANLPPDLVNRINRDVMRVMQMPDVKERLSSLGAESMTMTPAEFAGFVKGEFDTSAKIAKAGNIKA